MDTRLLSVQDRQELQNKLIADGRWTTEQVESWTDAWLLDTWRKLLAGETV